MNYQRLGAMVCFAAAALFLARCPDSNVISGPERTATPAPSPTATRTPASSPSATAPPSATATPPAGTTPTPGPASTRTGSGSATWTSIVTTRALCPEIRNQVGSSYSLALTVRTEGSSVALTLDHHDGEPGTYSGTLAGDSIAADYQGPLGGLACPSDSSVTPQTAGHLTATLTAGAIDGQYDEVYGSGPDAVTFHFAFGARFTAP